MAESIRDLLNLKQKDLHKTFIPIIWIYILILNVLYIDLKSFDCDADLL